jgi:hypothetical protein
MIIPSEISDFWRDTYALEEFALFAVVTAGKKAEQMAEKLDLFLEPMSDIRFHHPEVDTPFRYVRFLRDRNLLENQLRACKLGQYGRIVTAWSALIDLDPVNCTVEDLSSLKGIGPKTARFFLLHSRPDQRLACLDTHILHWLRKERKFSLAPKISPCSERKYQIWENIFLRECDYLRRTPAELDLEIWNQFSFKRKAA